MALYGNLRDYKFAEGDEDIRGNDVYGSNGERLGEIDDVIFEPGSGELKYVVIDTGGWLTSKKFLVPARQVMESEDSSDFHVQLTKDQIERFPAYDEKQLGTEERWKDYEDRYEKAWSDGPVLHREGSITHSITPTPEELPAPSGTGRRPSGEPFRGIAHDMPRFGATSSGDSSEPAPLISDENFRREVIEPNRESELHDAAQSIGSSSKTRPTNDLSERVVSDDERPDELTPRLRQDRAARLGDLQPTGGRRFREFQERLRRDREEILRRRNRAA
jgi:hypothetical protein